MSERPSWVPRALREEDAAYYLSLSPSTFRSEVAVGRIPAPIRLTVGRQAWLRDDLDAYLDRLSGKTTVEKNDGSEWMKAVNRNGVRGTRVR